ncbi:MAG: DNRLRE domain-containing protein [candidate division Zixibacteria bacterium]|nr:DNRLRE domain-containing protein [candidate division Zixibacteria bacterium]
MNAIAKSEIPGILVCLMIAVGWFSTVSAAEVMLGYDNMADAYVYHWASTTNYGASAVLAIDNHRNSLMCFDLSGISGTIDSAELTLNVHANVAGEYLYIAPLTRAFAETEVSWDSAQSGVAWMSGGGDFDSCTGSWCDTSTVTPDTYDSDVFIASGSEGGLTAIVQGWVDGDNYGLLIQASYSTTVNSREATNESRRPELYISYTPGSPEPSGPPLRRRRLLSGRVFITADDSSAIWSQVMPYQKEEGQ